MKLLTPLPETISTITIIPVSNGWVVQMPKPDNTKQQFTELMTILTDAVSKRSLDIDTDEIEKLVKGSLKNTEAVTTEQPIDGNYTRDPSTHVFSNFSEVLKFLSGQIQE